MGPDKEKSRSKKEIKKSNNNKVFNIDFDIFNL